MDPPALGLVLRGGYSLAQGKGGGIGVCSVARLLPLLRNTKRKLGNCDVWIRAEGDRTTYKAQLTLMD
ncbi:hypothetical protein BJ684DRAFT_19532 [Piptocephalis cylindrospora]|uniref:POP1 C-terminal domain-containing protein n=1 Tax=Piptocephalis cylindrospora TaxID=1907219 RepID=A0A4P9Y730_9FUNG|nr:hypothetical protein BJ684DRAFT_19532 [Piptocephalis cylindrospora]|eukprot:RKP14031.1 hypothetical protein BJ684DRAFT_19532 [Piptocephalis cylindrospora]